MSVIAVLLRLYRPVIAGFLGLAVLVELVAVTVICMTAGELRFSFWLALSTRGSAVAYWTLVVGILLVTVNLRQFVTNGVSRREFLQGAAQFMLGVAAGFTVVVLVGHGVESLVVGAAGRLGDAYPVFSGGALLRETGHVLPQGLAWMTSGALIAAGFYRFGGGLGLLTLVPGILPAAVASGLLALNENGVAPDLLPFPAALVLSLVTTALGAAVFWAIMRDVPIRRKAA